MASPVMAVNILRISCREAKGKGSSAGHKVISTCFWQAVCVGGEGGYAM